jgi:hypothetical protein
MNISMARIDTEEETERDRIVCCSERIPFVLAAKLVSLFLLLSH